MAFTSVKILVLIQVSVLALSSFSELSFGKGIESSSLDKGQHHPIFSTVHLFFGKSPKKSPSSPTPVNKPSPSPPPQVKSSPPPPAKSPPPPPAKSPPPLLPPPPSQPPKQPPPPPPPPAKQPPSAKPPIKPPSPSPAAQPPATQRATPPPAMQRAPPLSQPPKLPPPATQLPIRKPPPPAYTQPPPPPIRSSPPPPATYDEPPIVDSPPAPPSDHEPTTVEPPPSDYEPPIIEPAPPTDQPPIITPSPPTLTPPVKLPPPLIHPAGKPLIVVGRVHCKSCNSRGLPTLYKASPLQGAVVKLVCHNNARKANVQTAMTDKNGEFVIMPMPLTRADIHKCKVYLVKSTKPICNVPTNFNGGKSGALLIPILPPKPPVNPGPALVQPPMFDFHGVGPFIFEASSKLPCKK
ncbi:pistil-specific extensin-like protein [Nicotiana tomentosiformis]|uniref:pistil-specific extensin-like protein n=1 Tax=Nicotiana tomentosiformis TaxID=4098 RepID=UPI00051B7DDC|nr:pistil-specific extensin-like protein [Nicotiana tomentosiformis]